MRAFIQEHPIGSFFGLTFAIAWLLWIPLVGPLSEGKLRAWAFLLNYGAYAPALVGILMAAILNPHRETPRRKAFWMTFVVTWMVAFGIVVLIEHESQNATDFVSKAMASLAPAFVMAHAFSRISGVRLLLQSLIKLRGSVLIHLLAVTLIPFTLLLVSLVRQSMGSEVEWTMRDLSYGHVAANWIAFILGKLLFNNMFGEEVGWRGFALRHMQQSRSPLNASLSLGFVWGIWHYPFWYVEGQNLIAGIVLTLALSVIHTWMFNRSGGSLWAVGLMHASVNASLDLLPSNSPISIVVLILLAIVVVVTDKMWLMKTHESNGT